jgi:chaperone required for assembly of F1-ATPase
MDLSFDLKTVLAVEIDGETINTDGGKELYIDGVYSPSVLDQMTSQYADCDVLSVHTSALRIADLVFSAGETIDKTAAKVIAQEMAILADFMLRDQAAETLEWDAPTLDALRKIRAIFPELEAAE